MRNAVNLFPSVEGLAGSPTTMKSAVNRPTSSPLICATAFSLQPRANLVEPGFSTRFVEIAARSAADANRGDGLVVKFDAKRTGLQRNVVELGNAAGRWRRPYALGDGGAQSPYAPRRA